MKLPMIEESLKGKVIAVTGGGGVLCGMLSKALAQYGAKVAVLDLTQENADRTANEITAEGYVAKGYACNVLDKESIKAAHEAINKDFGKVDILLNGAGGNNPRATTDDEFFEPSDLGKVKTLFDLEEKGVEFVFNLNSLIRERVCVC